MLFFEWNEAKAAANLKKHGIAFEDATRVFDDVYLWVTEDRLDYGEMRFNATGFFNGRVLTVTYAERNDKIRIISARLANGADKKNYARNRGDA